MKKAVELKCIRCDCHIGCLVIDSYNDICEKITGKITKIDYRHELVMEIVCDDCLKEDEML